MGADAAIGLFLLGLGFGLIIAGLLLRTLVRRTVALGLGW